MPAGMPAGMPSGMAAGAHAGMAAGMPGGMPAGMPGGMAMGDGAGGMAAGGAMDPAAMTRMIMAMQQQTGGPAMSPEQAAQAQQTLGGIQEAMAHPLSRAETLEVFDELGKLGVLTESMRSEARDCILLAPPGAGDQAVGQSGAMLKAVVLPQLVSTKAKFAALGPDEQDQLAQGMAEALRDAQPSDRAAFLEGLGQGYFPAAVVAKVRAQVER